MKIMIILILCFSLSGCANHIGTPGPTPSIENYGSTPLYAESIPGPVLRCHLITDVKKGATWNGIQIGKATYDKVVEILKPNQVDWNEDYGFLVLRDGSRTLAETCFWGNIISAMLVFDRESYPDKLEGLLEQYGQPDYVSWGPSPYDRSLIWANDGILATVDIEYEEVGFYIFFSPIKEKDLKTSWLVNSIGRPDFNKPTEHLPPKHLRVQDPWGFNEE